MRSPSLTVFKTEEELQEILNRKEAQLKEKDARRKKQAQNVAEKLAKREQHKYEMRCYFIPLLIFPAYYFGLTFVFFCQKQKPGRH